MTRALIAIGVVSLGIGLALAAPAARPGPGFKNIVLIGWDAADRRNIKHYWNSDTLPNLRRLASEGTIVALDMVRFTDTKAGWVQILTGYVPEKTGVFSNERYGPVPRGLTVFERLEQRFGPENIATIAVIGKKKHMDADPPVLKKLGKKARKKLRAKQAEQDRMELVVEDQPLLPEVVEQGGAAYVKTPGKPYHLTRESLDVFVNDLRFDHKVGRKALEMLERYRDQRFFLFVHFAEIDHMGHRFGEGSSQHRGAYRSADKWTGKIMRKLERLGLYDDTLIYVTSDHGFMLDKHRHWDAPYVFLATNDRGVMRRGDRVDIAPTILDRYGFDLDAIEPPLDGHSLLRPYTPPVW